MVQPETTKFYVVLPIELPEDLKRKIETNIQNAVFETLASADLIKEGVTEPSSVILPAGILPDIDPDATVGYFPSKDIFSDS